MTIVDKYLFRFRAVRFRPVLVLFFQIALVMSLAAQQKPTRQSSLEAFSKGDYVNAYKDFSQLLVTYPKDPLYKYYAGVCLVRLGREPEKAVILLNEAQKGSMVVRTVPADVLFWLGRAQQMSGLFDDAVQSFNTFTDLNGKRASRELDIPLYLQQCSEGKGRLSHIESTPEVTQKRDTEPLKPGAGLRDTIPVDVDQILEDALQYQQRADSLYRIVEGWKRGIENTDSRERTEMRTKIAEAETLAASWQQIADRRYAEAQNIMNALSFTSLERPVREKVSMPDTVQRAEKARDGQVTITAPDMDEKAGIDTVKKDLPARDEVAVIQQEPDNQMVQEKAVPAVPSPVTPQLLSVFEVRPLATAKPEKIPINEKIPSGLIYRIQVAVFRNPVDPAYFKGISPIYGFRETGNDITIYYAGMFRKIADARNPLASVKQKGFRDAFIVALADGKRISLERAAVLEKEWGTKPFTGISTGGPDSAADTIPPELCFRIEVMRSPKPVKDDVLEAMQRISGTKGLDIEEGEKNSVIYLIGKFITYESAINYADLLVRNGYREAKVVARLGSREVPVEAARELFEKVR